jgi:TPP-dependent pyruvate/acetoin dehydrogenase alpha subunit
MRTTNAGDTMTQPQVMHPSRYIEIRKSGYGYPTVEVDGWDIGAWIAREGITVERSASGLNYVTVRLVAQQLRVNEELVTSEQRIHHVAPYC